MGMLSLLFILIILIVAIIIVNCTNDKKVYNTEISRIIEEKGHIKLSTEILLILAEEGYRPLLGQKIELGSDAIEFKIRGIFLHVLFNETYPDYFRITLFISTFEVSREKEIRKIVNLVNRNIYHAQIIIVDDGIYSTCNVFVDNYSNLASTLFHNIDAVICAYNEFRSLDKTSKEVELKRIY